MNQPNYTPHSYLAVIKVVGVGGGGVNALNRMIEGRTSIIIAHRLSTIQRADRIVVMHKGRIREIGSHQQLLAARGVYWKLYQLQYKDQEVSVPGDD